MTKTYFLLLLVSLLASPSLFCQPSYTLKHNYKARLWTINNQLQRGVITAIDDSTVTVVWHGSPVTVGFTDIDRITVFRKGTVGKWMLVTVPVSIVSGLAIARNQPTPNKATRSLNNVAAVVLGVAAGVVEAALAGKLLRKKYAIGGDRVLFRMFVSRVTSSDNQQNRK